MLQTEIGEGKSETGPKSDFNLALILLEFTYFNLIKTDTNVPK